MSSPAVLTPAQMRRKNLRLALILAVIAAAFFTGFVVKMVWLGQSH